MRLPSGAEDLRSSGRKALVMTTGPKTLVLYTYWYVARIERGLLGAEEASRMPALLMSCAVRTSAVTVDQDQSFDQLRRADAQYPTAPSPSQP